MIRLSLVILFLVSSSCDRRGGDSIQRERPTLPDQVLAVVDGEPIGREALRSSDPLQFLQLENRIYELERKKIGELVDQKLLEAAAKKQNSTVSQFLESKLQTPNPSRSTITDFAKKKNLDVSGLNPELYSKLEDLVRTEMREGNYRSLLDTLRTKSKVKLNVRRPSQNLSLHESSPRLGPVNAPVQAVIASDFACRSCKEVDDLALKLREKFEDRLSIKFLYVPSESRDQARVVAEHVTCAGLIDGSAFWKYRRLGFDLPESPSDSQLKSTFANGGIPWETLAKCVKSSQASTVLIRDIDKMKSLGIRSSPSLIINGLVFAPETPIEELEAIVRDYLRSDESL
jgi:protein-disulfide isomerase